jgi:hypothetical protein
MVFNEVKEDFCTTAGNTALSNSPIFGLLFAYLSPTRPFLSLPTLSPMPATYDQHSQPSVGFATIATKTRRSL